MMFCEVLAVQERLTLCCGAGVPVPVRDSTVGEFEAALANDMLPDATPVPAGVNVTVNCTCCPAGITTGNDTPLRTKAEPVTLPEATVTFSPLALSVPFCCEFVPTATLPKSIVVGLTANCPRGTDVPVPVNGMARFEFDASETTETLPASFPEEGGAKMTVKVKCCPGVSTSGGVNPLMLNPVPVTVACEIVTFTPPVLVRVSDSCWLLP